jgi:hypothetical protein
MFRSEISTFAPNLLFFEVCKEIWLQISEMWQLDKEGIC